MQSKLLPHLNFVYLIQQQNQVKQEIELSIISIFWMSFPTVAIFFWEVQGNSKLFDNISESSLGKTTVKN